MFLKNEVPVLFGGAGALRHHEQRAFDHGMHVLRARGGRATVASPPRVPRARPGQPSVSGHIGSRSPRAQSKQRGGGPFRAHGLHHRLLHLGPRAQPTLPPVIPLLLWLPRRARTHSGIIIIILFLQFFFFVVVDGGG